MSKTKKTTREEIEMEAFEAAVASEASSVAPKANQEPKSEEEQFFEAIKSLNPDQGQAELAKKAIANPQWAKTIDSKGFNALTLALLSRKLELAKVLLSQGSDPNAQSVHMGWTPLVVACSLDGIGGLGAALLEKGADPNSRTHHGLCALSAACTYGNEPLARALIAKGAEPDSQAASWFPLLAAAGSGNIKLVEFLLENGADPKRVLGPKNGFGPLHQAAKNQKADVVALLLGKGADPNSMGIDGQSPLHIAASKGSISIAKALLAAGADVAQENAEGFTPAELAASDELKKALSIGKTQRVPCPPELKNAKSKPKKAAEPTESPTAAAKPAAKKPAAKKAAVKKAAAKPEKKPAQKAEAKTASKSRTKTKPKI